VDHAPASKLIGMTTTTSRLVIIAGATASVLVYSTAATVFGDDLLIKQGSTTQAIGPVAVTATALIAGLAGWGLLALLERTSQRPARLWTIISAIVLAVSLAGPLGSGADLTSKLALTGMHLLVGLILIPNLARNARYKKAVELKRG
jgi:uncharacterized protein DUF6069